MWVTVEGKKQLLIGLEQTQEEDMKTMEEMGGKIEVGRVLKAN